ncbi:squalene/phytoene synthase family protein [Pseudooceanicola sp. C21-150M6]|uniref:squalene/phytoene synthase family protein n=1 Tax=Pseudooceanicola sp. C21-150M6 TaxID=3434355 RepID=UPI003D7F7D5F
MLDDVNACAALVERGDPARFRAAMAAPVSARAVLFPLYAFNLEVARAPWVTQEPMIARMRLQWWRDALAEIAEGRMVRRHEVVTPLALAVGAEGALRLQRLVDGREADVEPSGFADAAALWSYLEATSAPLIEVAALSLGGGAALAGPAGRALGLVNWFAAIPALEEAGQRPLPDGREEAVAELARTALADLAKVRRGWGEVPAAARPAYFPLAGIGSLLRRVARQPGLVAAGLVPGEGARLRLALTAATGRMF